MKRISGGLLAMVMTMAIAVASAAAQERNTKAPAPAPAVVNLNTASVAQLDALPGIGLKVAERIVEYRQKHGGFKRVEELMNVRGVGEKGFLKLKPMLTLGSPKAERTQ
ncbi:MAG: ComEA family DNA-binding protein [Vicinamibacterales bacterium]